MLNADDAETWALGVSGMKRPKGRCRACRGTGYVAGDPEGDQIDECTSCGGTGLSEAQRHFDANQHKMIDMNTGLPRGRPPAKR